MTKHKTAYMIDRLDYALDYIQSRIELPVNHKSCSKAKLRKLKRVKVTLLDCQGLIREFMDYNEKCEKIINIVDDTIGSLDG